MSHVAKHLSGGVHLHTLTRPDPAASNAQYRFYTRELPNGKYLASVATHDGVFNGKIFEGVGNTRNRALFDLTENMFGFDPRFIFDGLED